MVSQVRELFVPAAKVEDARAFAATLPKLPMDELTTQWLQVTTAIMAEADTHTSNHACIR